MMNNFKLFGHVYREAAGENPAAGGDSASGSDVQDWGGLVDDAGDVGFDESVESADATPPAEATPVAVPAATPAVPAQAAPVAPAEPAAQPAAVPAQQPVSQPEPAQAAPVDMAALRKSYEDQLTGYYAIDPQTAAQLQTEPELVLPKLAAKVHLEVLDAVMGQLPQRVSAMIEQITAVKQREAEAENTFFGAYPELKAHKDAVLRMGQMYRAANPTATREQAVKAIGDFMMTSLGLARAPAAPAALTPANLFVPAGGSGGGQVPQQNSIWDEMLGDDD